MCYNVYAIFYNFIDVHNIYYIITYIIYNNKIIIMYLLNKFE